MYELMLVTISKSLAIARYKNTYFPINSCWLYLVKPKISWIKNQIIKKTKSPKISKVIEAFLYMSDTPFISPFAIFSETIGLVILSREELPVVRTLLI